MFFVNILLLIQSVIHTDLYGFVILKISSFLNLSVREIFITLLQHSPLITSKASISVLPALQSNVVRAYNSYKATLHANLFESAFFVYTSTELVVKNCLVLLNVSFACAILDALSVQFYSKVNKAVDRLHSHTI